jgi:Fe-S cluster assembly iron-binding protein IscA
MTVSADTSTQQGVVLTEAAAEKAKSLLEQQGEEGLALRVQVQPGGCSGLIYQLYFDDREVDGDAVQAFYLGDDDSDAASVDSGYASGDESDPERKPDLIVRVDRMSGPYLSSAKIDFVDTIEKQGFTIDNPNASGSCACGDSFH